MTLSQNIQFKVACILRWMTQLISSCDLLKLLLIALLKSEDPLKPSSRTVDPSALLENHAII